MNKQIVPRKLMLALFVISLVACGNQTIDGTVVDGAERPLAGVAVRVEGSDFSALTNDEGEYSLDYVPGQIKVNLSKSGYSSTSFQLSLAEKARYPAARVQLFEIPEEKALFLISSKGYVKLLQNRVRVDSEKRPFTWDKPGRIDTYSLSSCYLPLILPGRAQFLDTLGASDRSLLPANSEGVLFRYIVIGMGAKIEWLPAVKESGYEVAPKVFLREVELAPGRYAFASIINAAIKCITQRA